MRAAKCSGHSARQTLDISGFVAASLSTHVNETLSSVIYEGRVIIVTALNTPVPNCVLLPQQVSARGLSR